MPGRAEGGERHILTSPQKYSPTKSTPYPKTRKNIKKSPRSFLHASRITRTITPFRPRIHRKALRRGGTGAGDEGIRKPSSPGSGSESPRGNGWGAAPVSDRLVLLSRCSDRIGVPASNTLTGFET